MRQVRIFTSGDSLVVRLRNPLSSNRDAYDGKFSFARVFHSFTLLSIRSRSTLHVQTDMPVQLFFGFRETRFFSKIGNNLSGSSVCNTCGEDFPSIPKHLHSRRTWGISKGPTSVGRCYRAIILSSMRWRVNNTALRRSAIVFS